MAEHEITMENKILKLRVDEKDARFSILDKKSGQRWGQSAEPFCIDGETRRKPDKNPDFKKIKNGIRVAINQGKWEIQYDMVLSDNCLEITLYPVKGLRSGESLEIEFPRGFGFAQPLGGPTGAFPQDVGYLVLPLYAGVIYPFGYQRPCIFHNFRFDAGGCPVSVFGVVKNKSSMAGVVKDRFDYSLNVWINDRYGHCHVSPVWRVEEGRLNYPRRLHYHFSPDSTYVHIAKAYRKEKIKEGRFVALREKSEKYPMVGRLVGAVAGQRRNPEFADGTFDATINFFKTARERRFDRAILFGCFPDPWKKEKTNERLLIQLKKAAKQIQSLGPDYHLSFYTQYMDVQIKKDAVIPEYVMRNRDGSPARSWYESYAVCGRYRLENARKDLLRRKEATGAGCIYVDIEGCGCRECFHPKHPATRAEDTEYRRAILGCAKDIFGAVATESLPTDTVSDIVDIGAYFNYYPYNLRDDYYDPVNGPKMLSSSLGIPIIPVPLYQLIYHDSVMNISSGGWIEHWFDTYPIEQLHLPLLGMMPDDFSNRSFLITTKMRETAYYEMLTHEFLTGPEIVIDGKGLYHTKDVQRSVFADGTVVIVNFSDHPYRYNREVINPQDFIILKE